MRHGHIFCLGVATHAEQYSLHGIGVIFVRVREIADKMDLARADQGVGHQCVTCRPRGSCPTTRTSSRASTAARTSRKGARLREARTPLERKSSLAADVAVARQLDAVAHRVARRGRVDVLHGAVFHLDAQAAHARTARGG